MNRPPIKSNNSIFDVDRVEKFYDSLDEDVQKHIRWVYEAKGNLYVCLKCTGLFNNLMLDLIVDHINTAWDLRWEDGSATIYYSDASVDGTKPGIYHRCQLDVDGLSDCCRKMRDKLNSYISSQSSSSR